MKRCVVRVGASALILLLHACGDLMVPPPTPVAPAPGTSPPAAPAAAARAEQANDLLVVRPVGWQRFDGEDGKVVFTPPDLPPERRAHVVVEPRGPVSAPLADHMTVAWRYLLGQHQARLVQGGQLLRRPGAGFDALSSTGIMQTADGHQTWAGIFLAAQGERLEGIVFVADGEDLWARYGEPAEGLLASARFAPGTGSPPAQAAPAPPPPAYAPPAPAPAHVDQGGPGVRQMYLSFARRTGPGAFVELGDYRFDHLTLFSNGLAHHGPPSPQGPLALDLNNVVVQRNLGRYEVVGDQTRIAWASGHTQVLPGDSGWQPLARVDGLRLQGTYADPGTVPPTWITFAPDGTFSDQGVVGLVASLPYREAQLEPPPGGSGTYALQDYALTLNYSYGASARMTFFVLPEDDVRRPRRIVLNNRVLGLHQ